MNKISNHPTHYPKKSLGQNFLTDNRIRDKIIQACDLKPTDTVLEIGPGKGVLSKQIHPLVKHLIVVEKDHLLHDRLMKDFDGQTIDIIQSDILKFPFPELAQKIILLGNIPYNISTPILEYAINNREKIKTFFMMVQLEFGQRLSAKPGSKIYGSLTCFAQFYADIQILFRVKNTCFSPAPKVESCFVRMDFLSEPRYSVADEEKFQQFIKRSFSKRRKTITNSLALDLPKETIIEIVKKLNLDERLRVENLSLKDFVQIFEAGEGIKN